MLTVGQVRAAARAERVRTTKSDRDILEAATSTTADHYDIFLSHSFRDRDLIVGTRKLIMQRKLSVYVDWINDSDLDREAVDGKTAARLRDQMRKCDTLFYAHSPSAKLSRWCPWELGYFDALQHPDRQVFVLPVVDGGKNYPGQEYLSLYPIVDLATYKHEPRRLREAREHELRMLRSAFGVRK
ncbi:hypothetical protein [Sphingomonas aerolata]|uniref:hypothetical protein n=1 Tax=Sphingomonas aerolata TaxID=185951 RepID=UPI002FE3AF59